MDIRHARARHADACRAGGPDRLGREARRQDYRHRRATDRIEPPATPTRPARSRKAERRGFRRVTTMTLDPFIDALCEASAPAVAAFTLTAMLWWEHRWGAAVRARSGYMPEAQRRAVDHRSYSEGLLTPPARETLADSVKAGALAWHGPRPVLACEVRP